MNKEIIWQEKARVFVSLRFWHHESSQALAQELPAIFGF